eukprot:363838-Chlamydomonas_euryale.AAC.1
MLAWPVSSQPGALVPTIQNSGGLFSPRMAPLLSFGNIHFIAADCMDPRVLAVAATSLAMFLLASVDKVGLGVRRGRGNVTNCDLVPLLARIRT